MPVLKKKESMRKKDEATTTVTLGIRLSGFRSFHAQKNEYVVKDKPWGKKIKDNTMAESIGLFFSNGVVIRKHIVKAFLVKLKEVEQYMEKQKNLRFYSSSLLFLFEGVENEPIKVDLRMIDFAHVHEIHDNGKDDGYLIGLKNVIKIFEDLAK